MKTKKVQGIFITGTDTGVGKTIVSAALIRSLQDQEIDAGYFKPIASGARKTAQGLLAPDVAFVLRTTGIQDPPFLVNPVCLVPPLAPLTAMEISGHPWRKSSLTRAFERLKKRHSFLIVEGVGGLMVPLKKNLLLIDLIKEFDFHVLVVSRPSIGTINHTLLTLTLLKQNDLSILGFLFNGGRGRPGLAEKTAPAVIESFSKVPFLGSLPFDQMVSETEFRLGSLPQKLRKMGILSRLASK